MTTSSTTSPLAGAPVVSVTGGNATGVTGGSVINVSSLVSQLVAATEAPQQAIIASQTQAVSTQISALGTLKSALSTFQSSLGVLDTPEAFGVLTASSSQASAVTATASAGAAAGTYSVAVSQLARAEQLVSNPVAGGSSATVGTGTLSLSLGGTSFSVSIDSGDDTLAGIASAINSAAGNPGIGAAVITGADGAHLVLSSSLTGAANTIAVTETDGGGALTSLTYGAGNTANYTQVAAPQDANLTISGIPYSSPSNTVSDALSGVTLDLTGTTSPGSSATLTIASDTSTIQSNVSSFVTAYNTLQSTMAQLGSYDATTNTAGPMLGDAVLQGIQSQVRQALYSIVNTGSQTYNSLASVGITTNSDGSLSLNAATFATALSSDPSAVTQLFSSAGGVASSLDSQLTSALATGGTIGTRSQTLVSQENALTQQTNTLNTQMTQLAASLTQQYSALNTLLSTLQSTSAYLTQAFSTLPLVQGQPRA